MWDPYAEFEKTTLPNGLTIFSAYWPNRPWQIVEITIRCGLINDPIGKEGLSHFVEHLVSLNIDRPTNKIREFFDSYGGTVNLGRTGHFNTGYTFFVPAKNELINKSFDLFGKMLMSAKLDQCIESEKKVIIGEYKRKFPIKILCEKLMLQRKALYPGYWLENSPSPFGNLETISIINQADLNSHYADYYIPENMCIIGVGNLKHNEFVSHIENNQFSEKKCGKKVEQISPIDTFPPLGETHHTIELSEYIHAPMNTGAFSITTKMPVNKFNLASEALNTMLSEILFKEVREKRSWVYDIHCESAYLHYFNEFTIKCNGLDLSALDKIENVVDQCIDSILTDEARFNRTKERRLARSLLFDMSGRTLCNSALEDYNDYNRIISLAEHIGNVENLTFGDVKALIPYLKPEMRWTKIEKP